jgi:hypothetical protein
MKMKLGTLARSLLCGRHRRRQVPAFTGDPGTAGSPRVDGTDFHRSYEVSAADR